MKKTIILTILLVAVGQLVLIAAPYYDNGSQIFTISAGTNLPLSASSYDSKDWVTKWGIGKKGTNFSVGGYGSLDYEVFINPYISLGGELGYQFNFIGDGNVFSEVPVLFKATYVPLQGTIEIPISLGVGFDYMSYDNNSKLALMAGVSVGIRYFFNDEWGLGINSGITLASELYSDNSKNGIFTFVPINLAVSYRH